jgi:multidrug efflux pump subunit AcrA (membrane-fusion protein)
MLDITENKVKEKLNLKQYNSYTRIHNKLTKRVIFYILFILLIIGLIILFLPWTQNVRGNGFVTALRPDQRPQTIQNTIPGKIDKWYVSEGDYVEKGDTIMILTEIRTEYFDPELIERTKEQVEAKAGGIESYKLKIEALDNQINTLSSLQKLKLQTAQNRITMAKLAVVTDSANYRANLIDYQTAQQRLERSEDLYKQDLISLTDLESRRLKLQETQAKVVAAENIYQQSVNRYINSLIEMDQIVSEFGEKIASIQAKKSSTASDLYAGIGDMAKIKNQLENIKLRRDNNVVMAPIEGIVTQAIKVGIGENISENTPLATIVPTTWNKAVEFYVSPINLPLMKPGAEVRFLFDGWPTVIFSGWPQLTYGTFGGEIQAVDNHISPNGKYRVLVAETSKEKWPDELRVGSGAQGIALLNKVPVWYELWRQLNGFPPDYYKIQY